MKNTTRSWLLTIAAAVFATHLFAALGEMTATALGLPLLHLPDGSAPAAAPFLLGVLGTIVLVTGMVPISSRLGLGRTQKGLALFLFLAWCYVANTVIEAHLFTTLGGEAFDAVSLLFPALCLALVLAALSPGAKKAMPLGGQLKSLLACRGAASWAWRLPLALIAFPVIYVFFGAIIYPLIKDVYNQIGGYMHTPGPDVVFLGALCRSAFFILVCLPLIAAWRGSRRALVLALGLALWVAVGGSALLSADFLPTRLRWVHNIEILADSMAHAWVLVAIFLKKTK